MSLFHRYTSILQNQQFLKLWLAQVSSKVSEHFLTFSLVILLFQRTESTFLISVFIAVVAIPPILFSAYAGVIADSFDRRKILLISNLLRFALVALAFAFAQHAIALIIIAFFISVVAQFFGPAEVASIPNLVPKDQLFTANSFYSFTSYAMFLIGYTLAGPMLMRLGENSTFYLTMVLYLVAAFLVSLLPPLDHHLKKLYHSDANPFKDIKVLWERLKIGLSFIRRHKVVMFVIIQIGIVFSIERGFISLVPSFTTDIFSLSIEEISYFIILPTGVGALIAAFIVNKLKHRIPKHKLINIGMIIDGAALFTLALWPGMQNLVGDQAIDISLRVFVVVLAFLSGFADPFIIIPAQTALHEMTPEEDRGRVFGALYTVINFLGIIPVLIIGAIAEYVSMNSIILVLGGIILVAAFQGMHFYRSHKLGTE
ncbi:MAG: MFS transporter [bacterium]